MNDNNVHLKVVTPEKTFFDDDIEKVIFRTRDGDVAILKNHAPLMTLAGYGIMKIFTLNKEVKYASLIGGMVLVENNNIIILTDDASWPHEIDINRAISARDRAKERLNKKQSEVDLMRANNSLKKALVRIDLANTGEKIKNRSVKKD